MLKSTRVAATAIVMTCATAGLQANAATIVGGSGILTGTSAGQIESWLVNDPTLSYGGPLGFTNVFTKTTGDTSTDFHAAADGIGPTFFVAQVTGVTSGLTGIVGGFNPQSWSSIGDYNYTITPTEAVRTAFIFNLTTGERRDQVLSSTHGDLGQYQTYNFSSRGPIFGGGQDLYVVSNLSSGYIYNYTYCPDVNTDCYSPTGGGPNLLGYPDAAGETITISGLEVFTISEVSAVPLPAALPLFAGGIGLLGLFGWRRKRAAA